jgi:hypothetical protein
MRNLVCILLATAAIGAFAGCERDRSYSKATQGTLQTLAQAARVYRETTKKEVSADYLADFKSVPQCLKIINKLPPDAVTNKFANDAWGNPIIYNTGAASGLPDGYFQSVGADGIANNTDDLRSTEAVE